MSEKAVFAHRRPKNDGLVSGEAGFAHRWGQKEAVPTGTERGWGDGKAVAMERLKVNDLKKIDCVKMRNRL